MDDPVDSPDTDFSPKLDISQALDDLKKTVDEINKKKSDQIDFDKLTDMMKNINSLTPYKQPNLNIRRPTKVFDSTIKKSSEPSKPSESSASFKPSEPSKQGVGAAERAAVKIKELTLQSVYNSINFYENKLRNNNLTPNEYIELSDIIDKLKRDLPKMKQVLREAKEDSEKRLANYYSRSFMDQNK